MIKIVFYTGSSIVFAGILALNFSSCSPVPYANVGQNAPLFKNKGEVMLSGSYAGTSDADGFGLQAAAAVDSSVLILGSFYSLKHNNVNDDWRGNGTYGEIGTGKFGTIGKSNFRYDVCLGIGTGKINNHDGTGQFVNAKFFKPFVQGSVGLSKDWIDFVFTPRFGVVHYTDVAVVRNDPAQASATQQFFVDNKTKFVFEPSVTFRFGYQNIKGSLNYSISTFNGNQSTADLSVNNAFVSLGICALITNRYK
jgi:hypothetical protein